jgi:hypothetical protein
VAGKASRQGNTACLNSFVAGSITNAAIPPPGVLVGALSATLATGVQTSLSCAASGGGAITTKAIQDDAVLVIADAAGAVDTMELILVNGALAVGATSITFDSQTIRTSHPAGSGIWLIAFKPYLALNSGAPADNALGTEVGFTGYLRQAMTWTAPTAADPPVSATLGVLTFGPFTAGTGATVSYSSLMDIPLSAGVGVVANMYAYWTLTTAKTPGTGDSIQVAAAAISMSMS